MNSEGHKSRSAIVVIVLEFHGEDNMRSTEYVINPRFSETDTQKGIPPDAPLWVGYRVECKTTYRFLQFP